MQWSRVVLKDPKAHAASSREQADWLRKKLHKARRAERVRSLASRQNRFLEDERAQERLLWACPNLQSLHIELLSTLKLHQNPVLLDLCYKMTHSQLKELSVVSASALDGDELAR